jgi:hypothetical protein
MKWGRPAAWPEGTGEKLAQAAVRLDAAAGLLVGMRLSKGPGECASLMTEAAALLEEVRLHWRGEGQGRGPAAAEGPAPDLSKTELLASLRAIRTRMEQLGKLNDAAVTLCRGWLSAQPLTAVGYTAEGLWADAGGPGGRASSV